MFYIFENLELLKDVLITFKFLNNVKLFYIFLVYCCLDFTSYLFQFSYAKSFTVLSITFVAILHFEF